jgi:hypothetical protein
MPNLGTTGPVSPGSIGGTSNSWLQGVMSLLGRNAAPSGDPELPPDAASALGIPTKRESDDFTDQYNTPLAPEERPKYQDWLDQVSKHRKYDARMDLQDYDMQGAFKSGAKPTGDEESGHFKDTFKKPNHPTFSKESQYSTPDNPGGNWKDLGDDKWEFQATPANLKYRDRGALQDYFKRVERTSKLTLPPDPSLLQPQHPPTPTPMTGRGLLGY